MRIVLLGDSIRKAYQPLVAEALAGRVEVIGSPQNGGDSANLLAHLDAWAVDLKPDRVHFNCGLHDIKVHQEGGPHQVEPDDYQGNLRRIVARLNEETSARLVWATTTPVVDEWHQRARPFARHQADIDAYNAAALEVMQAAGIAVNDLGAVIRDAGADSCIQPDGVHMNERGNRLLAEAVVAALGLDTNSK